MNKIFYIAAFFLIFFTGCSSKKYYEPDETQSFKQKTTDLDSKIIDINNDGATLENTSFLSKKGILENKKPSYKFLNYINDTVLASDSNATIYIKNDTIDTVLPFDKNIVSASISKNLLAFGAVDNSLTLYDLNTNKILFKEYAKQSSINNVKITNPIFLNSVVLYPTLDGKVIIVDLKTNAIIKTINIDPQSDINNIIFLKDIGQSLVAATTNKLFTFINGRSNIKDLDIQSVIVHENYIYVATLDGQIIQYDLALNELNSKKFKFAKIVALAYGSSLYALESQSYLLKITPDFKDVTVYDFSFDEEEKVIAIDNKIYFEDEYIELD
ncbi:MAG: hypothetical protein WA945_03815 [Arcobacteraceae bacterium]